MATRHKILAEAASSEGVDFQTDGLEDLVVLSKALMDFRKVLTDAGASGEGAVSRTLQNLTAEIAAYAPSVTVIGAQKAGKTAVVNALAGSSAILPENTAPWTSAITTLHLNAPEAHKRPAARIRLFSQSELESRADAMADQMAVWTEADTAARQSLCTMGQSLHARAEARLGSNFATLAGSTLDLDRADPETLSRFLVDLETYEAACASEDATCLADLAASVDLDLAAPHVPLALCLRDVPGSASICPDSRANVLAPLQNGGLCVVVLSALEDPANIEADLFRQIAGVDVRRILVFVNRIDAMPDPETALPAYHESLLDVLSRRGLGAAPAVIYGSAHWAAAAMQGETNMLAGAAGRALASIGQIPNGKLQSSTSDSLWVLSGLPALWAAVSSRLSQGSGQQLIGAVRRRALTCAAVTKAVCDARNAGRAGVVGLSVPELDAAFDRIETKVVAHFEIGLEKLFYRYRIRVDQAKRRFDARAASLLEDHLGGKDPEAAWMCSPAGFRALLKTTYDGMSENLNAMWRAHAEAATEQVQAAYAKAFGPGVSIPVVAPVLPEMPQPLSLGRETALDVRSTRWAVLKDQDLSPRALGAEIDVESELLARDLRGRLLTETRVIALDAMRAFLSEHQEILNGLVAKKTKPRPSKSGRAS